ncbi:hypothetical protein EDC50_2338 [Vulcaniibacterium tengchongense]|uniref:Uncharacterized protein n=1 Tax=Vulcaniibacterium tengchongense TaxID=1273429 RepID=A0A3N4V2A4_9GAMM|nr:hypothetical protein EDC50_2338 [Vulcaniibacterium tengchongense]
MGIYLGHEAPCRYRPSSKDREFLGISQKPPPAVAGRLHR